MISTNPDNGNSVAKNSTVTVNVSTGAANVNLPNVQGTQGTAAQTQLQNAGFTNVSLVPDPQSTLPSGEVDHMSPAPGSYPPGQAITLYVSGGGVQVPNVTNQTVASGNSDPAARRFHGSGDEHSCPAGPDGSAWDGLQPEPDRKPGRAQGHFDPDLRAAAERHLDAHGDADGHVKHPVHRADHAHVDAVDWQRQRRRQRRGGSADSPPGPPVVSP